MGINLVRGTLTSQTNGLLRSMAFRSNVGVGFDYRLEMADSQTKWLWVREKKRHKSENLHIPNILWFMGCWNDQKVFPPRDTNSDWFKWLMIFQNKYSSWTNVVYRFGDLNNNSTDTNETLSYKNISLILFSKGAHFLLLVER